MRLVLTTPLSLALVAWSLAIAGAGRAQDGDKAAQVIKQARAAIGGDSKLASITSIEMAGKLSRLAGDKTVTHEVTVSMLLPDKYKQVEVATGYVEYTRTIALDGAEGWTDLSSSTGFGGKGAYIQSAAKASDAQSTKALVDAARAEFARSVITWLLAAPASFPVTFSYAGEGEMNRNHVDMVDVKGPGEFAVRLFFDKQSHLPALMTYGQTTSKASAGSKGAPARSLGELKDTRDAAQPDPLEVQVQMSDYRSEGGVLLPHQITRAANGETFEDLVISRYRINPPLRPQDFKKK